MGLEAEIARCASFAVVASKRTLSPAATAALAAQEPVAMVQTGDTECWVRGTLADVLLTVDSRSAVDVMIERTGARGIARGTGERDRYSARVEYLQRTDDVRVGDVVVTSGLGCRYPAGVLVGRVAAVTRREFGIYQEVEVAPAVNFSRLSEVLVLATGSPDRPGCRGGTSPTRVRGRT